MTDVVCYENLTWPEVAALPRDLPLALPLGEGFTAAHVTEALGVARIAVLPALPFGWAGSVLAVDPPLLRRVVQAVFSGPREDGFTQCYVVHNGGDDLEAPGIRQLTLARAAAPALPPVSATPQRVILVPCGHTEQHGHHLPLNTDTIIIDAIARGVVAAIPGEAEMLPTLPYGVSMYRASFAGTMSLGGRVYEDFLLAALETLVQRSADRFYLVSGHGGNCSFLHNVVKYIGDRHHHLFAATAWLHTSGHVGAPAIAQHRRSQRGGMGHAGELETAFMLHLRPDLCRMDRVVDEVAFISTPNYYMDWIEGGALTLSVPWEDDTRTGSYGAGSLATAENGARWLAAAIEEKIDHVREIHEQARQRLARRAALARIGDARRSGE